MKDKFDPNGIEVDLCEPISLEFEQDPFWFPVDEGGYAVRFKIQRSAFPSIVGSNILVFIQVNATAETKEKSDVAHFNSIFRFGFKVDNLKEYSEVDESDRVSSIHQGLLLNVTSIAISSVRGLLRGVYANTVFSSYILPVLSPKQIMEMDEVGFKEVSNTDEAIE